VLDNGLGDHLMFRTILPEIKAKYSNLVLAVCYPEVFMDDGVKMISIAEARTMITDIETQNIYAWCEANNWTGPLTDAFRKMYL
jgi:hypothetical protein